LKSITVAPNSAAISHVPSVLPESMRITSAAKQQLSKQARMFDRSFFVGIKIETGQRGACMI
jgi:hypothetical protein